MGGGKRNFQEVRKARQLAPSLRSNAEETGAASHSASQPGHGLNEPICEQQQTVSFRLVEGADVAHGEAITVVPGSPPAVTTAAGRVGELTDPRQSETLLACIKADYSIFGEVTAIDVDLREGLASVAGVRMR